MELALLVVEYSVQSSEVDWHLFHLHGLGPASLRWWEPELIAVRMSLVEHSAQMWGLERLVAHLVVPLSL